MAYLGQLEERIFLYTVVGKQGYQNQLQARMFKINPG